MKLISYNVNGIRAALKKGLSEWVAEQSPDVFCIQESKLDTTGFPLKDFEDIGYVQQWHSAEKKGYSGVATFSKQVPNQTIEGMGMDKYDLEGRVLRTDFDDLTILNCYFPSGSSSEERHEFKMEFLDDFKPYIEKILAERQKVIVVGDYNIVHLDYDIHNPQRKDNPSGYRPEERKWMDHWFDGHFTDAYRSLYPEEQDVYSWWSYRAGSRQKNKGWRIDYVSVTDPLKDAVKSFVHLKDDQHSDHCALVVEFEGI
jgi:exodeoxyribonuclease-3